MVRHCEMIGDHVLAHSRQSLDITDQHLVFKTIDEQKPDVVINCAAWTDVDGCEFDKERAFSVNAEGPENLASACEKFDAEFVTISTDYVFDGKKQGFYTQSDETNPISVYGLSKLEGERRAQVANPRTVVARTGFVFGEGGRNFLSTIVERARRGEKLRAIADARGTPTFAVDLAARLRELATLGAPAIFHVVNSGSGATYEEFTRLAVEIADVGEVSIEPVSDAFLHRPAPRPANSCLRCLRSEPLGLAPLRNWQDALRSFVSGEPARMRPSSGFVPART